MKITNTNLDDIVSCLLTVDPYRIVFFGSLAAETRSSESDIDLLVILDSEAISQTYEERMKRRLTVRNSIRENNRQISIDLVVYTKAECKFLRKQGASFLNGIESSGETLYEKAS